jgi:hypothetical protein
VEWSVKIFLLWSVKILLSWSVKILLLWSVKILLLWSVKILLLWSVKYYFEYKYARQSGVECIGVTRKARPPYGVSSKE